MTLAACPACVAVPSATEHAQIAADHTKRSLSLPYITCAGCIQGAEAALNSHSGVSKARINFSLKRASIFAAPNVSDAELIETLKNAGFDAFVLNDALLAKPATSNLAIRLGVAGFAMMNVMLLSVAIWSGATDVTRDMFHWISAGIALPATVFAAQPFFGAAFKALRAGRVNMDVPISLAIILALAMSLYETSQSGEHAYFDAALSLTFFLLIGRFLDERIKGAARSAAKELSALEPATVTVELAGVRTQISLTNLQKGAVIFLPTGSRLPADGQIIKGDSLLDMSFITGECDPVQSLSGADIPAGVINLTGPLWVKATNVGADSSLQRIVSMIEQAETARNSYTSLADRAARLYVPIVHFLALSAFVFWVWWSGDIRFALNVAVAVLIITCPCALGLAVPAVTTAVNAKLFGKRVILKGDTALERLADVDTVVFDKTGTLSEMQFDPNASYLSPDNLVVLKSLADLSNHPISKSIAKALAEVTAQTITGTSEIAGFGITGFHDGVAVSLSAGKDAQGNPVTLLKIANREVPLSFDERLMPWAKGLVQELHTKGFETVLLSGDSAARVAAIHQQLGTGSAQARMTPTQKTDFIRALMAKGKKPLMVGDGLNDTAALAFAHASIAPSTALDVSRNAADVLVLKGGLDVIPEILTLTKKARRAMVQNFALAIGYNLIAIPVAFAGFATPLIAALAMSLSSISVILNAVRIRS